MVRRMYVLVVSWTLAFYFLTVNPFFVRTTVTTIVEQKSSTKTNQFTTTTITHTAKAGRMYT